MPSGLLNGLNEGLCSDIARSDVREFGSSSPGRNRLSTFYDRSRDSNEGLRISEERQGV